MRTAGHQTHFDITDEIIEGAVRHSCTKCAVALVLEKKYPQAAYVAVHTKSAEVLDHLTKKYYHFSFPDELVDWIENFDEGEDVEPSKFFVPFDSALRTKEQFASQYWKH